MLENKTPNGTSGSELIARLTYHTVSVTSQTLAIWDTLSVSISVSPLHLAFRTRSYTWRARLKKRVDVMSW